MKTKLDIFSTKELKNFFINFDSLFETSLKDYEELQRVDEQKNLSLVFLENKELISEENLKKISENENFIVLCNDFYLSQNFSLNKTNIITPPISVNKFIDLLNEFIFKKKFIFKNTKLHNCVVSNLETQETNHLTQAENLILLKLFNEKKVKKRDLERDALQIKQDINTSSIESHLNRIRKKLKKISSNFTISSKDKYVYLEAIS